MSGRRACTCARSLIGRAEAARSHAAPDQDPAAQAETLDEVDNIIGKGRNIVRLQRSVTRAVPTQINGHGPAVATVMPELWCEDRVVACPAMQENHRCSQCWAGLVVDVGEHDAVPVKAEHARWFHGR